MSDFDSSLPVRTQTPGDIQTKISDGTTPTQYLAVDSTGRVTVKLDDGAGNAITSQVNGAQRALDIGINVAGTQIDPRQIRSLVFASDKADVSGSVVALDSATLTALENITVQNGAGASAVNIQDGGNSITVDANNLDIRDLAAATDTVSAWLKDATGNAFSTVNPLPVTITQDNAGTEINDYATSVALAAAASANHDYTVTALKTLLLTQVESSGSGKIKVEVKVETGVGSNTFSTKFVQFNSTADPNTTLVLKSPISVAAGVRVRVTITNRDLFPMDVYSTVSGNEVP